MKTKPLLQQSRQRQSVCTLLSLSLCSFQGAGFGTCPDGEAERNLVHEISQVVDQVQNASLNAAHQISEEVAQGIDRPTDCDDEAHGLERGCNILVHAATTGKLSSLTLKDLEQDVAPSAQAQNEAQPGAEGAQGVSLPTVTKRQHGNSAQEQPPEHA